MVTYHFHRPSSSLRDHRNLGIKHTPEEVREFTRTHEKRLTAGHARRSTGANLLSLPSATPKPVPIVGVLKAG
ncbi:hypothetical protein D9543_05675 [Corynebacterium macginleyi]|uniref:Uncharacterized protein n=1 Tax=Corynebacterium macginleyi TaxID=38290 RepID=A0A3M0G6X6_9CORY|nr:hypothetical protein D9543_05675 [Corynebacterium macginleyi]RMB65048.1 hypothetical protein D9542_10965 [Corynebacterium macginleyi]RMB65063.1 hypothetical protein D9V82_09295 [Corynebacterium macginleyi]